MVSPGTTSRIEVSWTTTSLVIESIRVRAVAGSTSVTNASQSDDRCGVRNGTPTSRRSRPSWMSEARRIMST